MFLTFLRQKGNARGDPNCQVYALFLGRKPHLSDAACAGPCRPLSANFLKVLKTLDHRTPEEHSKVLFKVYGNVYVRLHYGLTTISSEARGRSSVWTSSPLRPQHKFRCFTINPIVRLPTRLIFIFDLGTTTSA